MGKWRITDPTTNRSMVVSGDQPPDQNDIAELFSKSEGKHPEAEFRQGEPEGLLSRVGGAAKEAIFGSPERADAEGTGVSQQPTLAKMVETGLTGAAASQVGAAPFNPAILRALGLGLAGGALGGKAGQYVGSGLEAAGFPAGTKHVAGTVGGLVGGFAAPFKGAEALSSILKMMPHSGMSGVAKMMIGDVAVPAAAQAATAVADPLVATAQALTKRGTFANAESALAWLKGMNAEQQAAVVRQLPGTAGGAVAAEAAPAMVAPRPQMPPRPPVPVPPPAPPPAAPPPTRPMGPFSSVGPSGGPAIPLPPIPEAAAAPARPVMPAADVATYLRQQEQARLATAGSPDLQSLLGEIPGPTLPPPPIPGMPVKGQTKLPTIPPGPYKPEPAGLQRMDLVILDPQAMETQANVARAIQSLRESGMTMNDISKLTVQAREQGLTLPQLLEAQ